MIEESKITTILAKAEQWEKEMKFSAEMRYKELKFMVECLIDNKPSEGRKVNDL